MLDRLVAAMLVGVVLFGGLTAIYFAFSDSVGATGDHQAEINESVSVDHGDRVTLADSELAEVVYDEESNVSVYNQSGAAIAPDGNWSWTQDNGTLVWDSNPQYLANGSTAEVTYGYREPTDSQSLALFVGTLPMQLGDAIMLVFLAATMGGGLLMIRRAT